MERVRLPYSWWLLPTLFWASGLSDIVCLAGEKQCNSWLCCKNGSEICMHDENCIHCSIHCSSKIITHSNDRIMCDNHCKQWRNENIFNPSPSTILTTISATGPTTKLKEKTNSNSMLPIVLGVAAALVIIIVVIAIGIIIYKRKRRHHRPEPPVQLQDTVGSPAREPLNPDANRPTPEPQPGSSCEQGGPPNDGFGPQEPNTPDDEGPHYWGQASPTCKPLTASGPPPPLPQYSGGATRCSSGSSADPQQDLASSTHSLYRAGKRSKCRKTISEQSDRSHDDVPHVLV